MPASTFLTSGHLSHGGFCKPFSSAIPNHFISVKKLTLHLRDQGFFSEASCAPALQAGSAAPCPSHSSLYFSLIVCKYTFVLLFDVCSPTPNPHSTPNSMGVGTVLLTSPTSVTNKTSSTKHSVTISSVNFCPLYLTISLISFNLLLFPPISREDISPCNSAFDPTPSHILFHWF